MPTLIRLKPALIQFSRQHYSDTIRLFKSPIANYGGGMLNEYDRL
jgi:hypothetical protein